MFVIGDTLRIKETDVIGTVTQVKKEAINESVVYYITIQNSYGLFTLSESEFEAAQEKE